ncbi:MAG: VWA domain-containing protein [Phenylobacterium sp.]
MQRALEDFLRALRAADVRVSPAEAIDAHRAVAAVGFADRELLKDSLAATLAKSAEETQAFDAVFETFFNRGELTGLPPPDGEASDQALPQGVADNSLARMLVLGDNAGLAQLMEQAAREAGVREIRIFTQRNWMTRRLLEAMGVREVEAILAAARESAREQDQALARRLEERRRDLQAEAARFVQRQHELYAEPATDALREDILTQKKINSPEGLRPADLALMQALVRRMARRLAARYSRRRSRAVKGKLDVRRTLRRSMGYGGVPFEVHWKREKVEKPSIVCICDVSTSVAAAAQFLLTFLYSLNEVVERLEAFAFSGRLIRVNDLLDDHGVDDAIVQVLRKIGFQSTNYGASLQDFCDRHLERLDRHTTVIVLGDGRTNYLDPRLDLMRLIQQRSRSVIWLNPEPATYWGYGDSEMDQYRRFCHVAKTCNTLADLERIVDEVLRSYVAH